MSKAPNDNVQSFGADLIDFVLDTVGSPFQHICPRFVLGGTAEMWSNSRIALGLTLILYLSKMFFSNSAKTISASTASAPLEISCSDSKMAWSIRFILANLSYNSLLITTKSHYKISNGDDLKIYYNLL